MKRFFIILFSTAMLISVAFFVSCGDESSSDDGSPSGGSFAESPGTTTLSAPSGLTATAASSSSVEVSWYPVSGAVGYYVYASEYSSSSTASLVSTHDRNRFESRHEILFLGTGLQRHSNERLFVLCLCDDKSSNSSFHPPKCNGKGIRVTLHRRFMGCR